MLADGTGDCDEQTNAYLSILRTKGIPGWFVFGALVDLQFTTWELHAWGYIMLPLDEAWCTANLIDANDCFVEASVDVVNNKWLLHTTNAYVDWMEEPDPSGDAIASAYQHHLHRSQHRRDADERSMLISTAKRPVGRRLLQRKQTLRRPEVMRCWWWCRCWSRWFGLG